MQSNHRPSTHNNRSHLPRPVTIRGEEERGREDHSSPLLRKGSMANASSGKRAVSFAFAFAVVFSVVIAVEELSTHDFEEGYDYYPSRYSPTVVENNRTSKFFPLFTVVRFANSPCVGTNNLGGTCYSRQECTNNGGVGFGSCAGGVGVCCVVTKACGTSSSLNCTYFVNPGYPGTYAGGDRCTLAISKCNSNVCQLRLDFRNFNIQGPDANGNCVNDFFQISGGGTSAPKICGVNTGEHMYIDFQPNTNPITLSMTINNLITSGRTWSIKATQISCDSTSLAPSGCLMYFTSTTGTIKSFNYGTAANTATATALAGTREMVNLNYGVCVAMAPGYCSITWSQAANDPYSFTVSGDTDGLDTTILGTPPAAQSGAVCTTDYIVIPHPSQNGVNLNTDRFCGNALVPTTTSSKPFVLTVVTDANELGPPPDSGNRGFCLNYRQMVCM